MIHHITYCDERMTLAAQLCKRSALKNGCQTSNIYSEGVVDALFYRWKKLNKKTLSHERGAGYWLWKPKIILEHLFEIDEDDYLVYTDAGVEIIKDINHIPFQGKDVFLFGNMYEHEHWCKYNVQQTILSKPYKIGKQCQASVIIVRNNDFGRQFIFEWMLWCHIPGFIDDSPCETHFIGFQEHRHDQAILTCVAAKYGIEKHWWPASYNNGQFIYDHTGYESDCYPVIFNHHRKRNDDF